jgi:urease accessory protein
VIEIVERAPSDTPASLAVALPFDDRQRSRLRVTLTSGEEAALLLPRGTVLRGGDRLRTACGRVVAVEAAPERVSVALTDDVLVLTRAAYHLGNRHVPVEVRAGALLYLHDHVLDEMVRGLGLLVREGVEPFEPEAGAYARGHGHGHGHGHGVISVPVKMG